MSADESIMARVNSLLRKAERSDNEFEAAIFNAKAQELMTRHSIDTAMLASVDREGKPLEIVVHRMLITGAYAARKLVLIHSVAVSCGCQTLFNDHGAHYAKERGHRYSIKLWGTKPDTLWAETLYESLVVQMEASLKRAVAVSNENGRTFGTAFIAGFTGRVNQRLKEATQQAVAEAVKALEAQAEVGARVAAGFNGDDGSAAAMADSVALVLAAKADRVEDEYRIATRGIKTRTQRVAAVRGGGYRAGKEAGSHASFARGAIPSSTTRALSG